MCYGRKAFGSTDRKKSVTTLTVEFCEYPTLPKRNKVRYNKWKGGDVEVEMGNIGANIEALRKEKNMTQEELGQKIGLTPSAISNIERGRSAPSVDTLWRLSDCLGVTIDSLFSSNIQKDLERLQLEEKLRTVDRYLSNEITSFSCNIGNRSYVLECEQGNIKYQACFVEKRKK